MTPGGSRTTMPRVLHLDGARLQADFVSNGLHKRTLSLMTQRP